LGKNKVFRRNFAEIITFEANLVFLNSVDIFENIFGKRNAFDKNIGKAEFKSLMQLFYRLNYKYLVC